MTVAPELSPASVARRAAGPPRRRRSTLRSVPALDAVLPVADPGEGRVDSGDPSVGIGDRRSAVVVGGGRVDSGDRRVAPDAGRPAPDARDRQVASGGARPAEADPGAPRVPVGVRAGAVHRTVSERREVRPGVTMLVERTLVERQDAAPLVLEEVVEPPAPAGRWAATLEEAVERHPAGRRLAGRVGPVGLVAVPDVDVPTWTDGLDADRQDAEPGAGAGREHHPAAPVRPARPRPAGVRVVRPATPRLRLSRRGQAAVVLLWIAAAVVLLVVAAGRVQDLTAATPVPASAPAEVTVAPGETLWSIAERVAPSSDPRDVVTEIRRLNGLGSTDVRAGQTLLLRAP